MKRKIIFLQYILQQEKTSMMYRVFEKTCENPIKNDFVEMCKKYLGVLISTLHLIKLVLCQLGVSKNL